MAILVFGVLVFAGIIPVPGKDNPENTLKGKVVVWGTFNNTEINKIFDEIESSYENLSVSYVKKEKEEYQNDLIEAFAKGTGPDLFFITPDMVMQNENFIYKVPYKSYLEKTFRDAFVDGAEIYLASDGVWAFPTVIDPIVIYYNKNLFANEGLVRPPVTWDELFNLNQILTKKENNGVINQSMIALGQYNNINYVKNIISALFLQNNNPIVKQEGEKYYSYLNDYGGISADNSAKDAIDFFIQFSNMSNSAYSWNRSLPNSFDMFVSGNLAIYIGRASDLFKIEKANPNLSYDVTQIPQIKNINNKRTYGEIYGLAVSNRTKNLTNTFNFATTLLSNDYAKRIAQALSLPPASRVLLYERPEDPYLLTFYNSAIIARSWLDPNPEKTDTIFSEMIEDILSNRYSVSESLGRAQNQMQLLFK